MQTKKSARAPRKKRTSQKQSQVLETARKDFGFESLRPGQLEAVEALLRHQDSLVVMPTGSGKSAIYQIAGSIMEGTTLVISPLIALQKDQVDSINAQNAAGDAVALNSTQRVSEAREAFEKIEEGTGKYIFLAPEQLRKQDTIETLASAGISLFVVDEAHCISEWGHDFRPDYLQLGPAIKRLGCPTVLAMTATASPEVRREIVDRLGLRNPKMFVHCFDRPNIYLRVDHFQSETKKMEAVIHRVHWADKPGIVYAATRKAAEELMQGPEEEGVNAVFYHGGLKASERTEIQEKFMSDGAEVIVATNAFGMGIDKPDIRFVYHYDIPDSLDSYYQEIGRAGRDGEKAEAVLFFRHEDLGIQKFHSSEGKLDSAQVEKVAAIVADQEGPVETEEVAGQVNFSGRKLTTAIHRLEDVGALEILPTGEVQLFEEADVREAAQAAVEEQERRREMRQQRLRHMQEYADASTCRREHLLRYFGDNYSAPCHNCDNCESNMGTRREVTEV
jgi:ATP-dependent DNA helicase RecQ